jgi:hypothetical protein
VYVMHPTDRNKYTRARMHGEHIPTLVSSHSANAISESCGSSILVYRHVGESPPLRFTRTS